MAELESWDFFVSFPGPDLARAEEVAEGLRRLGWSVFIGSQSLRAGDRWKTKTAEAIACARVVVVLLSDHTKEGDIQQEEIGQATQRSSHSNLIVVPVYLDGFWGTPEPWEFGLGLHKYRRIDLRRQGLPNTLDDLVRAREALEEGAPTSQPQAPSGPPKMEDLHTIGEFFHEASLKVDRHSQWSPLVTACTGSESALFLLHGPTQQNLDLFVSRVWYFLAQECGSLHQPYQVPFRWEFAKPRSVAAWENHLRMGLAEEGGRGTAEDLLREAARSHPVFLVVGRSMSAEELDEMEQEALGRFLNDRLPELMEIAARGRHPVRALLATHYERKAGSLVDHLHKEARAGCRGRDLNYRKLPPVRPLRWDDIEDFLDNLDRCPPPSVVRQLKAAFEKLDRERMEYRQVLKMLERELH